MAVPFRSCCALASIGWASNLEATMEKHSAAVAQLRQSVQRLPCYKEVSAQQSASLAASVGAEKAS
eukprot:1630902-Alexandrium_andersonii.AAC.1